MRFNVGLLVVAVWVDRFLIRSISIAVYKWMRCSTRSTWKYWQHQTNVFTVHFTLHTNRRQCCTSCIFHGLAMLRQTLDVPDSYFTVELMKSLSQTWATDIWTRYVLPTGQRGMSFTVVWPASFSCSLRRFKALLLGHRGRGHQEGGGAAAEEAELLVHPRQIIFYVAS